MEQTEATVSATIKLTSDRGADILFTVRSGATEEDARIVLDTFVAALKYAKGTYNLEAVTNGGNTVTAAPEPQQPAQQGNSGQSPNGDDPEVEVLECAAKSLVAVSRSKDDSTLMWKVVTDKSQYPVPMYEEVCQDVAPVLDNVGINLDQFVGSNSQPAKHDLTGWTAHYVTNEKGWPKKIVGLTK